MKRNGYLDLVADELVDHLRPIIGIKGVTANPDLLGKYTEASVRSLVRRFIRPMRVCTGAVVDDPLSTQLRQIDMIIWSPFPIPALFDVEGFGLVPKSSAFGVIEVKRSNYTGVERKLQGFLADVDARKIVSEPGGPIADYSKSPGIGIVCVLEGKPSAKLKSMIDSEKVIAIFERIGKKPEIRRKDILVLVNFLQRVTWRYRVQGAAPNHPEIDTE